MISSAERLSNAYYDRSIITKRTTSNAEFNKDAEFMSEVKMMVIKASFRSEKFHAIVLDWAKEKANALRLKHSKK